MRDALRSDDGVDNQTGSLTVRIIDKPCQELWSGFENVKKFTQDLERRIECKLCTDSVKSSPNRLAEAYERQFLRCFDVWFLRKLQRMSEITSYEMAWDKGNIDRILSQKNSTSECDGVR